MFKLINFFAFWGAEKHVIHIAPFRPTTYILMRFRCLEVSNRIENWYKFKNYIFVGSKPQLYQLEIQIFIYKFICQISLWISVSYVFCEFNRVASRNKGKSIILVRSSFQISQLEILVSYSKQTYVNVNVSFPNTTFEGNLEIMCLASHFDIIERWKLNVGHRAIYIAKKILHTFVCVKVRILVEMWNIY